VSTVPLPVAPKDSDALGPVRAALLALAARDAERMLAAADADAAATLAVADAEAETIRARARSEAETDAAAFLATEQARAHRLARSVELRARRAAYDDLVHRVHEAVRELSEETAPTLTALARSELGPEVTVTGSPDGGVVAEAGGRRVSYTLTALADRAVADLLASRAES
jgi:vacuolar-type H+-ATPase subunit E/Vma4